MAAAAYKVSMIAALGSPSGKRKIFSMTASDVNGEYWLFQSGASELALNGTQDVYIVDTILSAAGTDTSQSQFYLGGQPTTTTLLNATSIYSTQIRPFMQAPFRVPAGVALKVKQAT